MKIIYTLIFCVNLLLFGKDIAKFVSKLFNGSSGSYEMVFGGSEEQLKKKMKKANAKLKTYRSLCLKYKNLFNRTFEIEEFKKIDIKFKVMQSRFVDWFNNEEFHYYKSGSKFLKKYNSWLAAYERKQSQYTEDVLKTRNYRVDNFNRH